MVDSNVAALKEEASKEAASKEEAPKEAALKEEASTEIATYLIPGQTNIRGGWAGSLAVVGWVMKLLELGGPPPLDSDKK